MKASSENLPLISIVVPSLNQGQYLRDTLESIFSQHYPHLQVIVMDGGSTDGSVDIIRSYEKRLGYWQSRPDGGQSAAINEGVSRCTGELVAWLNSDDFYWRDSLWTVGRAYRAYPGHGLYIGNGLRFNQTEGRYTPFNRKHLALNREVLINGIDYILQPATFFLRSAWEGAGGLNPELHFCMDWDLLIRIAGRYPAVLINEFLAVSREHTETKTSKGNLARAYEIALMVESHSHQEITLGSLFYLLENLLGVIEGSHLGVLREYFVKGIEVVREQSAQQYGFNDGFPELGDPQDGVYLPFVEKRTNDRSAPYHHDEDALPSISVITPSLNQAPYLEKTLESILQQGYPGLETIVIDGGSNDGSVDILKRYDHRLTHWISEPDRGPAHAINKGFETANGDIVAWLNSDDMYANDALWEAGKAFAADPELDMIFANALYIDEHNNLFLADHGTYRTCLYYGEMQPRSLIPAYWRYVHAMPQPTVFFRRGLLDSCGNLDEKYQFIFDFELFFRFAETAKIKKIERTMAFYRIHSESKTSAWNKFEIELYRFSRRWWPSIRDPQFWSVYRDFIANYMRHNFNRIPRGFRFWSVASIVGLSVLTRLGNPEKFKNALLPLFRPKKPTIPPASAMLQGLPQESSTPFDLVSTRASQKTQVHIQRGKIRYRSIFCSYFWPRHPGHSGGEIRDFHILRHLLRFSTVDFFSLHDHLPDERQDWLLEYVNFLHTPNVAQHDMVDETALHRTFKAKVLSYLREKNYPVLGPRYHYDAAIRFRLIAAYSLAFLNQRIALDPPDFLFVSPQSNPVAMMLNIPEADTRLIMGSYDVEAVRMRRFAASKGGLAKAGRLLDARRAKRFEKENLRFYDGIIAVSDVDKDIFVKEYGFPSERVLVIDNGVDPDYFDFNERQTKERPEIVYIGALSYLPNQQAAWRLIRGIMPILWESYPDARLWIVGQQPGAKLKAQSDGERIVVTGRVEDVRPYLSGASAGCVPLSAGSGTKYKVLEALSAGMPLVCTPLAIEGLELEDRKHLLLGNDDKELASALTRLLEQPDLVKEISRQGNEWVQQRYSWDAILPRMDGWLDALKAMPLRQEGIRNLGKDS